MNAHFHERKIDSHFARRFSAAAQRFTSIAVMRTPLCDRDFVIIGSCAVTRSLIVGLYIIRLRTTWEKPVASCGPFVSGEPLLPAALPCTVCPSNQVKYRQGFTSPTSLLTICPRDTVERRKTAASYKITTISRNDLLVFDIVETFTVSIFSVEPTENPRNSPMNGGEEGNLAFQYHRKNPIPSVTNIFFCFIH